MVVALLFQEFTATSRCDGARVVVRFDGELDCLSEGLARAEIEIALDRGSRELVLDLRGLTFMDARGVHVLLDTRASCQAQRTRLLLTPAPKPVQRILALCRVESFELLSAGAHPARLAA